MPVIGLKPLLVGFAFVFFLLGGISMLVWPEQLRDRMVNDYRRIRWLRRLYSEPEYLWQLRIAGAVCILAALFLAWLVLAHGVVP